MNTQTIPAFTGTPEQEAELRAVIAKHRGGEGIIIPVLHEAQEIYGYLPLEVQKIISEELAVPLAEIYSVVTFYTQFSLHPQGENKVSVCLGTACYVKGAGEILEKIKEQLKIGVGQCSEDRRFSLEATRCIGACGLAPVITVNGDVYGRLKLADVEGIINRYK